MRSPIRYIACVLAVVMILQLALIAAVTLLGTPATVDSADSRKTIFQTDSKMAVYASPIVAHGSTQPQVVILGSSNTTMGIRPYRLQPYLGTVPIHNLSIGSEKFRAFPQMVDLIFRQTPKEQRHNYVFVFGISYPLILDRASERATLRTTVDDESRRFGLFRKTASGSTPRVADRYLSAALRANWPFLLPKTLYNTIIRLFPEPYWFGLAEPVPFTPEQSNTVQYSEAQNQERIDYYNSEILDTTGEYSFDYLMRAVERITAEGAHVVIVDLPTARWMQRATIHHAAYQTLRKPYVARLEKMQNVRYVDMEDGFADKDFYDGIHPRNRMTPEIARRIAPAIAKALEDTHD